MHLQRRSNELGDGAAKGVACEEQLLATDAVGDVVNEGRRVMALHRGGRRVLVNEVEARHGCADGGQLQNGGAQAGGGLERPKSGHHLLEA